MPCDYKNTKPIIAMKDIKKEFSGVWALSGITFEVYPGEIHCLVGENGAGKSTLMKVLSGAYTPTEGTITVDGKEYSKFDPFLSKQLGINIVYQENDLVPSMDVVENIFVGNEKTKGLGIIDYPAMRKETQRQMDDLGIHLNYGKFLCSSSGSEDGLRFPGNLLAFSSVQRTVHPTQKPVELCEYLIRTYTRPGELVADICAGSGTTAVAAVNTGRRFVCFETAPAFYAPATERIRLATEAVKAGQKGV